MIRNGNNLFLDLMDAVGNNDVNAINALCAGNPNLVNHFEKDGYSPLVLAAEFGRALAAKALLENGANVNFFSTKGICQTPLMAASIEGHFNVIEVLLAHGANVNLTTTGGESPIILAAQNFQFESVRLLIEHGANSNDVNVHDGQIGRSSLHYAAEKGNLETIIFLFQHGIDINCQDEDGFTPLMIADYSDQKETIELLMLNGANCDVQDEYGKSVIDYTLENENFCRAWLYLTADENNEIYRSGNNDVNAHDRDGNTLLHLASDREDGTAVGTILYLLFLTKDIKDKKITTEIFENLKNENMSYIVELRSLFQQNTLTRRSDIRKKNKKGKTAWELAIESGNLSYVKIFLAVNAQINSTAYQHVGELPYTKILLDFYNISDANRGLELGKEYFALDFIDFLFSPDADFSDEENDSYIFVAFSIEANIFTPEYVAQKIKALNNPALGEQLSQILGENSEDNDNSELFDFFEEIQKALTPLPPATIHLRDVNQQNIQPLPLLNSLTAREAINQQPLRPTVNNTAQQTTPRERSKSPR